MRVLTALMLVLCILVGCGLAQETKEEKRKREAEYKQHQKEEKALARQAQSSIPAVEIAAPADKVKALVLSRINSQLNFSLVNESNYQLRFRRQAQWASIWDGLAMESTGSRFAMEELALMVIDLNGKTTISSEHSVVREGDIGNPSRTSANHVGKWNLELQRFLDQVKVDLETAPPASVEKSQVHADAK